MSLKEQIDYFRKKGWEWQAIGVYFGISKTRAHQIGNNSHLTTELTSLKIRLDENIIKKTIMEDEIKDPVEEPKEEDESVAE